MIASPKYDRDMSKKLPPPREVTHTLNYKTEIEIPTPAEEVAESIREEVAEGVTVAVEGSSVTVTGPSEKAEKKRKALIVKALSDISAKKLREILAERLTLDEALKLGEIE